MLKTVRVPDDIAPDFEAAEQLVSRFFRSRTDDPEHGTIEIWGERYVLVRAASLSVEFFALVAQLFGAGRQREAGQFARNFLFDLAHALGRSDARNFHDKMGLTDPIARLSAGPVHFAHAGWAFVDILPESRPAPGMEYYLIYDHPYSFESDAWIRAGKSSEFPVCIMNAGYSSGWCEESFRVELVASEVMCRARGDEVCRFIMAPPQAIEQRVRDYLERRAAGSVIATRYEIPDFFSRKRAEDELRRLYGRLKEVDALKTRLFANVSHELRTPITIILGITERLLEKAMRSDERSDLEAIARSARLLLKHVNDLLEVAKLEAGRMELDCAETDLARLVKMVASYFEVVAADRNIAYVIDVPEELRAEVDGEKLQHVLTNLLSNAFKFVPDRGTVRCSLTVDRARNVASLAVADSGPGVAPDARDIVFDRFVGFEIGPAHRAGGTGLGLSIAKELTELHGGTITIDTAPEGGALLLVELPLRVRADKTVRAAVEPTVSETIVRPAVESLRREVEQIAPTQPASAPLVLVVEDNVEMRNFLIDRLATRYRVEAAADGQDGLEKARALQPDLIITDVMMPRMSGEELLRALRSGTSFDGTPIIVLTAKADDQLRVQLLRQGAQDHLTKPVVTEELLARAHNLIGLKRARDILQAELATKEADVEQLATQLARSKRELHDALHTARVARDQAERASQAKSAFLSLVSHELRTPLQSIGLNLEFLRQQRDTLGAGRARQLDRMDRASKRLRELVEALLEFVKQESGRMEVHRESVGLRDLAAVVLDDLDAEASRKHLELRLRAPEDLPPAFTDPGLLRTAIVNLVSNAIKYTDRGFVEVRIEHDADGYRIAVTDTGLGILPEQQALIFEPFTRLEPVAKKHIPGVGIGLSLTRTIIRALGGSIGVASEVGRGSTFTLYLPTSGASEG